VDIEIDVMQALGFSVKKIQTGNFNGFFLGRHVGSFFNCHEIDRSVNKLKIS
jgi:hypothetical protein